jgi:hypothetical protein
MRPALSQVVIRIAELLRFLLSFSLRLHLRSGAGAGGLGSGGGRLGFATATDGNRHDQTGQYARRKNSLHSKSFLSKMSRTTAGFTSAGLFAHTSSLSPTRRTLRESYELSRSPASGIQEASCDQTLFVIVLWLGFRRSRRRATFSRVRGRLAANRRGAAATRAFARCRRFAAADREHAAHYGNCQKLSHECPTFRGNHFGVKPREIAGPAAIQLNDAYRTRLFPKIPPSTQKTPGRE